MRYYIADLHFYHGAMNDRMDRRGFANVEVMNEYMINKWNQKVRENDEVVIIGDLSWGNVEETCELTRQLNGRLYLIQGNHDRFVTKTTMDMRRFVWAKPYEEMYDNKRKVILCHYPSCATMGSTVWTRTVIPERTCSTAMCMIPRIKG